MLIILSGEIRSVWQNRGERVVQDDEEEKQIGTEVVYRSTMGSMTETGTLPVFVGNYKEGDERE